MSKTPPVGTGKHRIIEYAVLLIITPESRCKEGASLIEYTVLLGILLVAVIATIGAVGTWINNKWNTLQQQLS
jgi:pilus assembly protein Flp/PilA